MDKIIQFIVSIVITQALTPFYINEKLLMKSGLVVVTRIEKMPIFIRLVIYTSTLIFNWVGIFYSGRPFSFQNEVQQQKMIRSIEQCNWPVSKQFLRFYKKLSLYVYYSLLEESK